ncbi:MAG: BAX inhibitor (BI)-1/YccA family protein, partial [Burkholderiaceae bacterium]
MNQAMQTVSRDAAQSGVALERNRVLRNTYWLLALSMVPTVLGAWIGVSTGIAR